MGNVDKLQDAEETVAQLEEEHKRVSREDLQAPPVKGTALRVREACKIPLSLLDGGVNMRTGDLPEIQSLAVSIREVGLINPLLVRAENGRFRLIAGRRRLAALHLLHQGNEEASVRCEVLSSDADESEQWILMLTENLQREDPPPLQIARGLRGALCLDPRLKASALARTLGKSPAWASRHLHLLDLPEKVQWRLETNDLNFTIADLIRQGQKNDVIPDDDTAIRVADEVMDGTMSPLELKKLVRPRTRVPEPPENYDELSRELDAARYMSREDARELDEPTEEKDDPRLARKRRSKSGKTQKAAFGVRQLESYLIGRLLRANVSSTLLRRMGVTRDGAYSYAWGISADIERLRVLHEIAADMLTHDSESPEEILG